MPTPSEMLRLATALESQGFLPFAWEDLYELLNSDS